MIPLARWLVDRHDQELERLPPEPVWSRIEGAEVAETGEMNTPAPDVLAARLQELEQALALANVALDQQREQAAVQERQLRDQFTAALREQLEGTLREGLGAIQHSLELALADVLSPFLSRSIVSRTREDLMELVRQTLRCNGPLVEMKAPPEFHDALTSVMEGAGINSTVVDGPLIELVFADRTEVFQILSKHWLAGIEGLDHEQ